VSRRHLWARCSGDYSVKLFLFHISSEEPTTRLPIPATSLHEKWLKTEGGDINFWHSMRWANSQFQGGGFFFLPQGNWCAGVDLGAPFNWWVVLKSTHLLVGFLIKIWMSGNWFNHASTLFYFFGLSFCISRFHITMKCKKQVIWLIF